MRCGWRWGLSDPHRGKIDPPFGPTGTVRCWGIPGGLTVKRWCEQGSTGDEAFLAIQDRLASAPSEELSELEIARDADGSFRLPIRTLLILGRELNESRA